MDRKYLAVNKNGNIGARAIKGGRNLRENYVKVARSRGRNVYAKKGSGFEAGARERIKTDGFHKAHIIAFVATGLGIGGGAVTSGYVEKTEGGKKVKVVGLVSVIYTRKKYFHAEMLFTWYGRQGFNDGKLLQNALNMFREDILPEIERIPFELVASEYLIADEMRLGIEPTQAYEGGAEDEMDFEVFIPKRGGRAITTGSAHISDK